MCRSSLERCIRREVASSSSGGQDANRQTLVSEDSKRTKAKPTRKNYSYGAVEGTRGRAVGAEIQEKG